MPKVAKNGRVTVPERIRDYLGLTIGTEVVFRRPSDGSVIIERADGTRPASRFAKLVGSAGPGLSTDELMARCSAATERPPRW
jgi:AbrB family looped-hinge helix DNA binding protein